MSVSPCRVSLRAAHTDDHAHVMRRARARAIGLRVTTAARLRTVAKPARESMTASAIAPPRSTPAGNTGGRSCPPLTASAPLRRRKRVGPRSALERLLWRKAGQEWMADTALRPHDAFGVYGGFAQQRTFSCAVCSARKLAFGRRRFPLLRNFRVADDPPHAFPREGKHCAVKGGITADSIDVSSGRFPAG
jgi:hypothetical protein